MACGIGELVVALAFRKHIHRKRQFAIELAKKIWACAIGPKIWVWRTIRPKNMGDAFGVTVLRWPKTFLSRRSTLLHITLVEGRSARFFSILFFSFPILLIYFVRRTNNDTRVRSYPYHRGGVPHDDALACIAARVQRRDKVRACTEPSRGREKTRTETRRAPQKQKNRKKQKTSPPGVLLSVACACESLAQYKI